MAAPAVSVVIPAHNAERTTRATLISVLRQTFADLEVTVVDDGSTDDTIGVVQSLGDERLRIVRQDNAGHAGARNTGIGAAAGRYVAVVDADDLWFPKKLETPLAAFRSNPSVRALHAAAIHVNDSLQPLFIGACPEGKNSLLDVLCFRGLPGLMCTLIAERSLLNEVGRFDQSLIILQDWELAIRLARLGALYSIAEPLALYRVHSASQSKRLELHVEPGERVLAGFFARPDLAPGIVAHRRYVYAHFYAMLCGGAFQLRRPKDVAFWARKAVACDRRVLAYLVALPVRRARKRATRGRAARVIEEAGLYVDAGERSSVAETTSVP